MENIIQLDTIRIDRHRPRKCTCKEKKFTIDTENREVTCECGMVVDPFEALSYLAKHYERINEQHAAMNEQRKEWMKEKPHSIIFKRLEESYRKGKMLPYCPRCNQIFDYTEINSHGNAEFYRRLQTKQMDSI